MNSELRKQARSDFEKDFFNLMNNSVFGKTMENVRNHGDIKLVKTNKRRSYLVSKPNYQTVKCFIECLLVIEIRKIKVKMNKPVYLGLSILEIRKILMYHYIKPKHQNNAKVFYVDTDSLIINIKMGDFYGDIANKVEKRFDTSNYGVNRPKYQNNAKVFYVDTDSLIINIKMGDFYGDIANKVEKRFDTSNYEVNRPLPTKKYKKVTGLMEDESGGKIVIGFAALRPKTYSYLMYDGNSHKKVKGTKKCVRKRILKFSDYKNCLLDNEIILKLQQRFKSEAHNIYTEEINKIALSSNDDKRLQSYDRIT